MAVSAKQNCILNVYENSNIISYRNQNLSLNDQVKTSDQKNKELMMRKVILKVVLESITQKQ